MPIRVVCKGCGAQFNAPDKAAGKSGKCPRCGESITVPSPAAAEPPPVPEPPTTEAQAETKVCAWCGETIKVAAIICRFCDRDPSGQEAASVTATAGGVVTTEQTGKKWKAMQLVGMLAIIGGFALGGAVAAASGNTTDDAEEFMGALAGCGFLLALAGGPLFLLGRIGAWWYHG